MHYITFTQIYFNFSWIHSNLTVAFHWHKRLNLIGRNVERLCVTESSILALGYISYRMLLKQKIWERLDGTLSKHEGVIYVLLLSEINLSTWRTWAPITFLGGTEGSNCGFWSWISNFWWWGWIRNFRWCWRFYFCFNWW